MNNKNRGGLKAFLFLIIAGVMMVYFISSCGKNNSANATASNIRYQVVNLSPDIGPVSLYINYALYNNSRFYYGASSGYFFSYLHRFTLPDQAGS